MKPAPVIQYEYNNAIEATYLLDNDDEWALIRPYLEWLDAQRLVKESGLTALVIRFDGTPPDAA